MWRPPKVLFTHYEGHENNVTHELAEAEREIEHSFTLSAHPNIASLLEVFYSSPQKEKLCERAHSLGAELV